MKICKNQKDLTVIGSILTFVLILLLAYPGHLWAATQNTFRETEEFLSGSIDFDGFESLSLGLIPSPLGEGFSI